MDEASSQKKSARNKRYHEENKETKALYSSRHYQANKHCKARPNKEDKAKHNFAYRSKKKQELAEKKRLYELKHKAIIAQKKKLHYQKHKKLLCQKQREYRAMKEKERMERRRNWHDEAMKDLLQDKPEYPEAWCKGSKVPRIEKWIDTEQLADLILYFKERGYPACQDVTIDYSFMQASCKLNAQPTGPLFPEVGLLNQLIHPELMFELFEDKVVLDGEEMKETVNFVMKLKTMPNQPEVDSWSQKHGVYWWIDSDDLMEAVRFWKKKGHMSLRGIRFQDIPDWEADCTWTETQKQENKKKNGGRAVNTDFGMGVGRGVIKI